MRLIDISQELFAAPVYPGDPQPRLHVVERLENGDACNLSAVYACLHAGTHADAQMHFVEEGMGIDEMPLDAYIGPCKVFSVGSGPITGADVDRLFPPHCDRLLIKGAGQAWLMESAAYELAARGLRLFGTDAQSVGAKDAQTGPHRALLGAGVAILEGLKLDEAEPGEYFLLAPPVKIGGRDGAPVRAVLISDYIFWSGRA